MKVVKIQEYHKLYVSQGVLQFQQQLRWEASITVHSSLSSMQHSHPAPSSTSTRRPYYYIFSKLPSPRFNSFSQALMMLSVLAWRRSKREWWILHCAQFLDLMEPAISQYAFSFLLSSRGLSMRSKWSLRKQTQACFSFACQGVAVGRRRLLIGKLLMGSGLVGYLLTQNMDSSSESSKCAAILLLAQWLWLIAFNLDKFQLQLPLIKIEYAAPKSLTSRGSCVFARGNFPDSTYIKESMLFCLFQRCFDADLEGRTLIRTLISATPKTMFVHPIRLSLLHFCRIFDYLMRYRLQYVRKLPLAALPDFCYSCSHLPFRK